MSPGPSALPEPRTPGRYAIEVVCSGNICRSPSAQVVLDALVERAGLDHVEVTSSGIGDWHVGKPMDDRSAAELDAVGFDPHRHRARQVDHTALAAYDLVLAMDHTHLDDLLDLGSEPSHTLLFRTFDPEVREESTGPAPDVPDPYYGGPEGFEEVLAMVRRTSEEIVRLLEEQRP